MTSVGNKPQETVEDLKMEKLTREIRQAENQKQLDVLESDIIQKYKMVEGEYQILVTVYQASELEPKKADFIVYQAERSTCDAFVQIDILNKQRKTKVRPQTNNPIFEQNFHVKFEHMRKQDLQNATITFTIYDKTSLIIKNSIIGSATIDWTNIYFRRNHEIYRGWLALTDPLDQNKGITGYLLINVAVLGKGDKITIHDSKYIKDPLTTIEDTITMKKKIYRAQHLVPLDGFSGTVNAFVVAKFSGQKIKSDKIKDTNPQWNQRLKIGSFIPNKCKYLLLQIWNANSFMVDELIGVIRVNFTDICEAEGTEGIGPKWGNIYGSPMAGKDKQPYNYATKMQLYGDTMGSHYRGRLMYKVYSAKDLYSKTCKQKINFRFPFKPVPTVAQKNYTLRSLILEGYELPSNESTKCYIQISMGPYLLTTVAKPVKNGKGIWYDPAGTSTQKIPQKNQGKRVMFPENIDEIPDIFIYFCIGQFQKDRASYKRIKAKDVLIEQDEVATQKTYQLAQDKSLDLVRDCDCGGTVTVKIVLYKGKPPPSEKDIKEPQKQKFQLRLYLYIGIGFPPANQTGDADPIIQFRVDGIIKQSEIKKNTLNPTWFQYLKMDVQLKKTFLQIQGQESGIMCICYDDEGTKKRNFIGRFWVPFSSHKKNIVNYNNQNIKIIHQKARWYHVQNQAIQMNNQSLGKVMLAYSIINKNDISKIPQPRQQIDAAKNVIYKQLKPITHNQQIQLYIIGLRSIPLEYKFIKIEARVSNKISKITDERYQKVKNGGTSQPYQIILNADLPQNKIFSPFLQFKIYSRQNQTVGKQEFQGYKAINIFQVLPKLKNKKYGLNKILQEIKEVKQEESEQTILNIQRLEEQLIQQKEYEKRKQQEQKKKDEALRQQALLNRFNQKQKSEQDKQIDFLQVPDEFGKYNRAQQQNQQQLQELLNEEAKKLEGNPQYNYIQNLRRQRQNDKKQEMQKQKLIESQVDKSLKKDEIQLQIQQQQKQLKPIQQIKANNKSQKQMSRKIITESKVQPLIKSGLSKQVQQLVQLGKSGQKIPLEYDNKSYISKKSERAQQERWENLSYEQKSEIQIKKLTNLKMRIQQSKYSQDLLDDMKSRYSLKFGIQESQLTQVNKFQIKGVEYQEVKKIIQLEQQHKRQVQQKEERYRFAAAVKLTLMNLEFGLKSKKEDIQTYEDFDTDEQQDLDIEPAWYKGRTILIQDYEQRHKPSSKLKQIDLFKGGDMKKGEQIRILKKIGKLKFIAFSFDNAQNFNKKKVYYDKIMYSKTYKCRIYILKGKSLISQQNDLPTTYLKIFYADKEVEDLKKKTLRQNNQNPEYYISQDIIMDLPGPAIVRIQVVQKSNFFKGQNILGYTQIDVQHRYFTKAWHLKSRKPIELRNLYSDYGQGSQGRLQTWIQLIQRKLWDTNPPIQIKPPPYDEYELRVIAWETKDCVFKDVEEQCNDVFVRASIGNKQPQQTDIHWRCRGIGSFNWRFKFRVKYPPKPEQMYSDSLTVQIWDKDVIGYNDLIGETRINLNKIHKIIQKCVKRKQKGVKSVTAHMKIIEKGMEITDKMYFDVFNHKQKDQFGNKISQGKVRLSFELVPVESIEKFKYENGFGRSQPNIYPTLAQPTGRLSFNFSSPLKFIKDILGQKIYNKICRAICCILVLVIIGVLLYFVIGQVVAKAIVG